MSEHLYEMRRRAKDAFPKEYDDGSFQEILIKLGGVTVKKEIDTFEHDGEEVEVVSYLASFERDPRVGPFDDWGCDSIVGLGYSNSDAFDNLHKTLKDILSIYKDDIHSKCRIYLNPMNVPHAESGLTGSQLIEAGYEIEEVAVGWDCARKTIRDVLEEAACENLEKNAQKPKAP